MTDRIYVVKVTFHFKVGIEPAELKYKGLEVDFSKISDFQISPKYEIELKYFAEMRNETKLKSSLNKD